MLCLPCSECGAPTPVPELRSWMLGDPLCSDECAERHPSPTPPEPGRALADAIAHLEGTVALVDRCIPQARSAERDFNTAAAMRSAEASFALGLAGGLFGRALVQSATSAVADQSSDLLTTRLWEVDRSIHVLLRRVMVLEALGFDVARHALPLVTHYGSISSSTPAGLSGVLWQLQGYLRWFHGGVAEIARRHAASDGAA